MNRFIKVNGSRHQFIFLFAGISLIGFFFLRTALLLSAWSEIDHTFRNLIYIYGAGFIYDLTFVTYFSLFFSFILLIAPNRLFHSRFSKIITPIFAFILLYGFYFTLVAEWLFWDEFHTRFNFLAIDYLIYRHEVTQNIYESYPLNTLLGAIFAAAALTLYFTRKRLQNYLLETELFPIRARFTAAITIAALLSYFLIGQPLKELSNNNYSNELAANGAYQFCAAFRNNKLNYRAFYALGDDHDYKSGKPFFFHLMTTSNHKPYSYPEGKIDLPSGQNRSGAVKYTDYAFKQFISRAKREPWFADTIFVVVAEGEDRSTEKTIRYDCTHKP